MAVVGVVVVTVIFMPVRVVIMRMIVVSSGGVVVMAVSMVVVTVRGGGVIVVAVRLVTMAVIVTAGFRRSSMVVGPMSVGVRDRMDGMIVMPVRVVRGGGVIVMTRMAVFVVRLVLVAHLGLFPSRCSAVIAAKSV